MNAKTNAHTPGPWEIETGPFPSENLYVWSSVLPNTEVTRAIATVHPDSGGDIQANARLIAAAPELLDALQRCKRRAMSHPEDTDKDRVRDLRHIEAIARAAIATATGESA